MQTGPAVALRRWRLFELGAIGLALGTLATILVVYFQRGFVPGDAFVYLGAGERLNAGHPLYAISPGDRPIGVEPPFWTVPLLSPPPIAVLWRPLAALPWELGVYLWWALDVACIAAVLIAMLKRRPLVASLAVMLLSVPLAYEIGVGNMNGIVLLGLVLAWRATARGEEGSAGALAGVMTAFKLTPAVIGWWLLTSGRWTAVRAALAAGLAVLTISVLGAGLDAHVRYLGVVRETSAFGARPLSLAGMALYVGVPGAVASLLPTAALILGLGMVLALRSRPGPAFAVAVLTMVFGSPTISINWFIYLLACLAPIVWPWPGSVPVGRTGARGREAAPGQLGRQP